MKHADCSHGLGHAGNPKQMIGPHGFLGFQVGIPHCFLAEHFILGGDGRDAAGNDLVVDESLHPRAHGRQRVLGLSQERNGKKDQ